MVDVLDTESSRRRMGPAGWVAIVVVGGVVLGYVLTHRPARQQQSGAPDTGSLTAAQYAIAQHVIKPWTAPKGTELSAAFATMRATRESALIWCPLVVTMVGRFAEFPPGNHGLATPPGVVIVARADPTTGRTCAWDVMLGPVTAPSGAADLMPAH